MALSQQKKTDIAGQYDPIRKRLQTQEAANLQGQKDQLARNAARLGGGPTGAFIKQEQIAAGDSAKRLQEANEGVDAQQMAAVNQAQEIQEQRDFQTSERLGTQGFASAERLAAQKYGTSERLGGQQFASGESAMSRALQNKQFELTRGDANKQNEFENSFNTKTGIATLASNLKTAGFAPDSINSLFKDLGLDSLGINLGQIPGVTAPPTSAAPKSTNTVVQPGQMDKAGLHAKTQYVIGADGKTYLNPNYKQKIGSR